MQRRRSSLTVIGAGPVGLFLAGTMAAQGVPVDVYERSPDPRRAPAPATRASVNLAISLRGLRQLARLGLAGAVQAQSARATGRLVHAIDGTRHLEPYSREGHALHFILRPALTRLLVDHVERLPGVRLHFGVRCAGIDPEAPCVHLVHADGRARSVPAEAVLAADGAYSTVRRSLMFRGRFEYRQQYLDHGYRELTIEPASPSGHALEEDALHVWRRDGLLLLGFPNHDGTFTLSLYEPFDAPPLADDGAVRELFAREFPEVGPLSARVVAEYRRHPPNPMVTIRCAPWTLGRRVALIGDAAHAVVPHLGQGVTAGFEDCTTLADCFERHDGCWAAALAEYDAERRPDADAIADLSLAHVGVLRGDPLTPDPLDVRLRAEIDAVAGPVLPPLYEMVAFGRLPFAQVVRRHQLREAAIRRAGELVRPGATGDEIRAAVVAALAEAAAG